MELGLACERTFAARGDGSLRGQTERGKTLVRISPTTAKDGAGWSDYSGNTKDSLKSRSDGFKLSGIACKKWRYDGPGLRFVHEMFCLSTFLFCEGAFTGHPFKGRLG